MVAQRDAGGGQPQPARMPHEQRMPDGVLEILDLAAQRRLRDVQPPGRRGNVQRFRDRQEGEGPEMPQLHLRAGEVDRLIRHRSVRDGPRGFANAHERAGKNAGGKAAGQLREAD